MPKKTISLERFSKPTVEYIATTIQDFAVNSQYRYGSCILVSALTFDLLNQLGIKAFVQAGTSCWPRVDHDDGVSPTHMSYVWELSNDTFTRLQSNILPEVHAWVVVPDDRVIIDLTTLFWPKQCEITINTNWPGKLPPKYLWCSYDQIPPNVIYECHKTALVLLKDYFLTAFKEYEAQWLPLRSQMLSYLGCGIIEDSL